MIYLAYLSGVLVSIIGRHVGGAVSHRIITGHYYSWWAGLIKGSVDSLLAITPSLGLLRLLLGSGSSTWSPFVVAIAYPTILALLSEKPDKLRIAQMRATIRGAIWPREPFSRSAIDREEREVDEEYREKWLFFLCQLIGCITLAGIAATVWNHVH